MRKNARGYPLCLERLRVLLIYVLRVSIVIPHFLSRAHFLIQKGGALFALSRIRKLHLWYRKRIFQHFRASKYRNIPRAIIASHKETIHSDTKVNVDHLRYSWNQIMRELEEWKAIQEAAVAHVPVSFEP